MSKRWNYRDTTSIDVEFGYHHEGYYDPGVRYGPPEKCYPPECSEEREVSDIWIEGKLLSRKSPEYAKWSELLQGVLDKMDLEPPEPEEPEREREYESASDLAENDMDAGASF